MRVSCLKMRCWMGRRCVNDEGERLVDVVLLDMGLRILLVDIWIFFF